MDVLDRLLATCGTDLIGLRDRALMLVGVSAGGRRRSELTALNMADLKRVEGGFILIVRRSKTDQTGQGLHVPVRGRAAKALTAWIEAAGIFDGRVFVPWSMAGSAPRCRAMDCLTWWRGGPSWPVSRDTTPPIRSARASSASRPVPA